MSFITPYEPCLLQLPEVFVPIFRECVEAIELAIADAKCEDFATVSQNLSQVRRVSLDYLDSSTPLQADRGTISKAMLVGCLGSLSSLLVAKAAELTKCDEQRISAWMSDNAYELMSTIRNRLTLLCSHANLRPPRLQLVALQTV